MANRARAAEEINRRKMARLRFRNLIRSVSLNRIWLEDLGDQKFSLNVKKNIAMLVRTKRKIGLLTMAEKSLIRTHHMLRTTEDRKKLVSLMAGLTCFHKIPPKVRARLSKCIKFMVISPGRKLIKEGDLPSMVYFVLTGEVEVTKKVYDHIQNTWVDRIEMISGPGDCLGDFEMIERCTRRHTYTTTNVVELLVVFDEDFERILRPVMEQQWMEKKRAIMALDYFNFFTKDQITNACKLCVLRQFEPLETIYYEDKGQLTYVHFVISGECMILQCLKMMVSQKKGGKTFELIDLTKEDTNSMFEDLTNTELLKILREENNSANKSSYDIDELIASEEDENVGQKAKTNNRAHGKLENHFIDVGSLTFGSIFGLGEKLEHRVIMARTTVQCLMIPRFWLYEKDQNPGNIWQRRRFYLDSTIPSRQTLFKDFLTTRQWQKFKKDLIQSLLNPNSIANPTRVQDVPIMCRLVEASEE